jgi:hypothetical protein
VAAVPFSSAELMRAIGRDRSSEELASAIQSVSSEQTEIVGVGAFPLSLPFYLDRTITLSTTDGSELTSNYLSRTMETWRNAPGATVRDGSWWREAVTSCTRQRVFVVRTDDAPSMAFLDGALPLVVATRKYSAFGPCGAGRLASDRLTTRPPDRPHLNTGP